MNKRGIEITGATVGLVLATILLVVAIIIFRPPTSEAARFFSSETLKIKDSKCLLDTQRAGERGVNIKENDRDNDGRLDNCDICLATSCCNSDNNKDIDLDGMPDYCDEAPNDATKVACKSGFIVTKDKRCTEGFLT